MPFMFGGCCVRTPYFDPAMPSRGYQITMNGPCYVDMVDRYLLCHGTKELVDEFYPSVKKAATYTMDLNRGPDGMVSMPDPAGEHRRPELGNRVGRVDPLVGHRAARRRRPPGHGPHGRAHGRADRRPSRSPSSAAGGSTRARNRSTRRCGPATTIWPSRTRRPASKSDLVFSCQLDGQWMAEHHGLPGVFRPDRVAATLATIEQLQRPADEVRGDRLRQADGTLLESRRVSAGGRLPALRFLSARDR